MRDTQKTMHTHIRYNEQRHGDNVSTHIQKVFKKLEIVLPPNAYARIVELSHPPRSCWLFV